MKRREFITLVGGAAAAWPLAAKAQQKGKLPLIGVLNPGSTDVPAAAGFYDRLRELGYTEGSNIAIERRYGDSNTDRFQQLAADLVVLKVGPGCVATSSIAKRRWIQGDRMQHHLIDPRTGKPAETDWLSVTVICKRAAVAEVYAKSLLIAGPEDAAALEPTKNDIIYLAVDRYGKLWGSNGSETILSGNYEHVK